MALSVVLVERVWVKIIRAFAANRSGPKVSTRAKFFGVLSDIKA